MNKIAPSKSGIKHLSWNESRRYAVGTPGASFSSCVTRAIAVLRL
ncbi:hypothetical protein CES85_4968 [Ochrobactrum quorumnocens]|uniref:Uncharacterized protein n=1 Tax=Ochrobactrum quorumnocens TaxID=271865 RepID=A0A248UBY3_9HYPH|nr:hypothetical protein CES85_4968 [[Ochrobactrum] quorumnocens]